VYYLIGSIGAGKSTAASNFRNLITYDEWIDERRPEAAVHESALPPDKVEELNAYFAEQFRKKNFALLEENEGIHVVDRSPLDPLTFGPPGERAAKVRALIEKITDKKSRSIARGHVIELDCDLAEIKFRCSLKHKYWSDAQYEELRENLQTVYKGLARTVICTRGRDASAVAAEIARVIFLTYYNPVDIDAELTRIAGAADGA